MGVSVFSYWSGPISWLERLSAASAKATGHNLTIFSYEPCKVREEGLDAAIEDASEIFRDNRAFQQMKARFPAYFSDHFRVEGLAQGRGTWVDLDLIFLKTLPADPYLFGWHIKPDLISNAVLRLPADSLMLNDYLKMCRSRPIRRLPPWWPKRKQAAYMANQAWRKVKGHAVQLPFEMAFPYGPPMLTHLLHKHGLATLAKEPNVFYPPIPEFKVLVTTAALSDFATDETIAIHLWRHAYRRYNGQALPEKGCWLGQKYREFDLGAI